MTVLFIDSNHSLLHQKLSEAGIICHLNYDWTITEIENSIHLYDGVVIRSKMKFTKNLIDKATKLKFIARAGAGMENIDVDYAENKGIKCLHAPEGNKDAVAEHALGMLLALFNNICRANTEVRQGKWLREVNRGIELMSKTVGIIGYGNMGSAFAQRLVSFGCKIISYDKYKMGFSNQNVQEVSLEILMEQSDVVSVHVPLTFETTYMINDNFINLFKKNIYIINTSRGKCLNTEDLVKNIQSGKVLGACLDVLEYETVSFGNIEYNALPKPLKYLIKSDKVLLTPHIAGWTVESNKKIANALVDKILAIYKTQN